MFKKIFVIAALTAGLFSAQASASFMATDWKFSGDQQATLDTETGIEWLDVSITDGMSISTVQSQLTTTYNGWRLPTQSEVVSLMRRFFHNVPDSGALSSSYTVYQHEHELFTSLLGGTYGAYYSYGSYLADNGTTVLSSGSGGTGAQYSSVAYINYVRGNDINTPDSFSGVFLVSDGGTTLSSIQNPQLNASNPNAPVNNADVSSPAGIGLAGLMLLLLGARRKMA